MTECYGYKFASQYGDEPSDTWVSMMVGITGQQIASALHMTAEVYPEWPPGAAQFRAMCLGKDPRNTDNDGNDATWQHRVMAQRTKEFDEEYRRRKQFDLVDITKRERAKAAGATTLQNLKAMF